MSISLPSLRFRTAQPPVGVGITMVPRGAPRSGVLGQAVGMNPFQWAWSAFDLQALTSTARLVAIGCENSYLAQFRCPLRPVRSRPTFGLRGAHTRVRIRPTSVICVVPREGTVGLPLRPPTKLAAAPRESRRGVSQNVGTSSAGAVAASGCPAHLTAYFIPSLALRLKGGVEHRQAEPECARRVDVTDVKRPFDGVVSVRAEVDSVR
jgi:hypothetical protein